MAKTQPSPSKGTVGEVFTAFAKLGVTCFGGPVAHLGFFRDEFVTRRKWFSDAAYADVVALCQFLPGPASSQTGMAIGLSRAGYMGMLAAWIAFTLPSALLLALFAVGVSVFGADLEAGWLTGLKLVVVAVVAQAVWNMARNLCPDVPRASIAVIAAAFLLLISQPWEQVAVIVIGGMAGYILCRNKAASASPQISVGVPAPLAIAALILFFVLLLGLPLIATLTQSQGVALFEAFYRAGSLVFGGGHVVLPLLQSTVVEPGWVSEDQFLAGYGAAQAVPGPLFTIASYLGFASSPAPNMWLGALIATVAIFVPSFLLVLGTLPFWSRLSGSAVARSVLMGINAAVVGLLAAAFYDPVWTSAVTGPREVAFALVAFLFLHTLKLPPWLVVVLGAALGYALGLMGLF